jgi:hypothetical protein
MGRLQTHREKTPYRYPDFQKKSPKNTLENTTTIGHFASRGVRAMRKYNRPSKNANID